MSKVHAGQQRQGGSGNHFEPQVRHTGGKQKGKEKRSQKQIRKDKYAKLIGQTKAKPVVDQHGFMTSCHCRGKGTCSYCVQQHNVAKPRQKMSWDPLYYRDRAGHRYTKPAADRYPVYEDHFSN